MKILTALFLSATLALPAYAQGTSSAKSSRSTAQTLPGTWKSLDAPGPTLSGKIILREDRSAVLAADGNPELQGTWTAESQMLTLNMPPYGSSTMRYKFNRDGTLSLTYENGFRQLFKKEVTAK